MKTRITEARDKVLTVTAGGRTARVSGGPIHRRATPSGTIPILGVNMPAGDLRTSEALRRLESMYSDPAAPLLRRDSRGRLNESSFLPFVRY